MDSKPKTWNSGWMLRRVGIKYISQAHVADIPAIAGMPAATSFKFPPLARVCHQIRMEVLPVVLETCRFYFWMGNPAVGQWLEKWRDTVGTHFRYLALQDYQHYYDSGLGVTHMLEHPDRCRSAILIDLRREEEPATYVKDGRCKACPETRATADRVDAVIYTFQRIKGFWRLTREGMQQILDAAGGRTSRGVDEPVGSAVSRSANFDHQNSLTNDPYELNEMWRR